MCQRLVSTRPTLGVEKLVIKNFIHTTASVLFVTAFGYGNPLEKTEHGKEGSTRGTNFQIDKTMFIKEVLQENTTLIITAPPGVGKTTNLKMLKYFLEIEVDEKGERQTKVDYEATVTDTENFYMFIKNGFKITKCEEVMKKFGKHPVISLSFECFSVINNVQDAVRVFKRAVHSAFKDHGYLMKSEKLSLNERKLVRFWGNDHLYYSMTRGQVVTGVRELARLVGRHWGVGVWVVVDDYDGVVREALEEAATAEDFRRVVRLTKRMVSQMTRGVNGLVTGVLPLSVESPGGEELRECTFLGDHRYGEFYGLKEEEVERIWRESEWKNNQTWMNEVKTRFGGYETQRGDKIYQLYPLLGFLHNEKFPNEIIITSELTNLFKLSEIGDTLKRLLQGEILPFNHTEVFSEEDIINVRSVLKQESSVTQEISNLLISYLVHHGILTYVTDRSKIGEALYTAKIPNYETADMIKRELGSMK